MKKNRYLHFYIFYGVSTFLTETSCEIQNGRRAGNGEHGVKRKREGQGKNGNGKDKEEKETQIECE